MLAVSTRAYRVTLIAALVLAAGLMIGPAWRESQTSDEAVYLTAGVSDWRTGDFRLNVEHPPLLKELMALPLLAAGARFDPPAAAWAGASQWDVAPSFLFGNRVSGQFLLFLGRSVVILMALALIALIAVWARRTWGNAAGAAAALLASVEPNLLANGHLATTDVGATLAVFASGYTFLRWLEDRTPRRLVLAAIAFAAAGLTRFTGLALVVVLPICAWVLARRSRIAPLGWADARRAVATFILTTFILTWAAYGFEVRRLDRPQDAAARQVLGPFATVVTALPLPAASYLSGVLWQAAHNAEAQPAYLFGRTSAWGWWYYFPVAMAVKLTLATMVLAGLGFVLAEPRTDQPRSRSAFGRSAVAVPLVLLTLVALASHLDLGVRYVLPSIALLVVAAAGGVAKLWLRFGRLGWVAAVLLVVAHGVSVLRFTPHFLPYANEAFGGPAQLDRYLIDANLDWGQDLPLLRQELERRGITRYVFRSFSTAPAAAYGLVETDLPTDTEVAERPFTGVVAVGRSVLHYPGQSLAWLRAIEPTVALGYSINLYDLRGSPAR